MPARLRNLFWLTLFAATAHQGVSTLAYSAEPLVLISAFTGGDEGAIHAYRLNPESGELKLIERTTDVEHPFFLAVSPDQKYVYSIHTDAFGGKEHEQVAAYRLDASMGRLKLLNRQSALGSASCFLEVDATGKTVLVANYSTGSVAALPVRKDGSLAEASAFHQHTGKSVDPKRQQGPYAHSIIASPNNRFAYAADLGIDKVMIYRLDGAQSGLEPSDPSSASTPAGAGPRHLTFDPAGKNLYAINELSNSVTHFEYDATTGGLTRRETVSTLPDDFDGTSYCADLKITPDGRFLYGTNRGHDSIAAYEIQEDGSLERLGIVPSRGAGPQNLAITENGKLLLCANMPGNNVSVFRIGSDGMPAPVGEPVKMPMPSCIRLIGEN